MAGIGNRQPDLEKLVVESVAKSLPAVLQGVLASLSLPDQNELKDNVNTVTKSTDATTVPTTLRGDRFYNTEQETVISQDLLSVTNKAFSRSLSKDKWKELTTSYTQIKDTESLLVAPTMEAGMKEELKKRHGYIKTRDLFSFDDGLAERQSAFLVVARPLLAALTALDNSEGEDDDEGPDPDAIKDLLEDALVLLGNANFRLNAWRQKRFSEFLTEVGKRTLREGIPADKHLFPDKFHAKIKSEHDHSSTNSKLISTPASKHFSKGPHRREQPFRGHCRTTDNSQVGGKRKWGYGSRSNLQFPKGSEQRDRPSNLTPRPARADYPFPYLKMLTPPTNRSATRLQFFVQNWKQTTQDTWTLQTIQGYKIPFCRRPGQRRMRLTRVKCHSDAYRMEKAIKDLLAKGAVREAKPQDDQSSSTPIPASSVTTWAGTEGDSPLNFPGTQRPRVVGLREPLPSKWLSNSASTHRSHSLERCLENGLGGSLPGDFHRGPLECGRGAVAHQCLGATSSNTGSENISVCSPKRLKHIHLRIDNTTAVAYINERGDTRSPALTAQALELWAAGVSLTAQHIPGIQNVVADTASRQIETRTEWTLDRKIFRSIYQRFYTPEVDLFASRLNYQLPKYVSRYPDPGALAVDAILLDWS